MHADTPAYGLWPLVVLNSAVFIICNYPGTPIVAKHGAFSL